MALELLSYLSQWFSSYLLQSTALSSYYNIFFLSSSKYGIFLVLQHILHNFFTHACINTVQTITDLEDGSTTIFLFFNLKFSQQFDLYAEMKQYLPAAHPQLQGWPDWALYTNILEKIKKSIFLTYWAHELVRRRPEMLGAVAGLWFKRSCNHPLLPNKCRA